MALLYISEYISLAQAQGGVAMCGQEPALEQTPVSFATTTQSAAFNLQTKFVRLFSDGDCHVQFGGNPTATTNSKKMTAGQPEYFGVVGGDKVAAVNAA